MTLGDFSQQAAAYQRARPGYPVSLLDLLACEASLRAGSPVVDLGAGTGIFTRMLAQYNFDVTAVEPNEDMMSLAGLPEVRWVRGTFEDNSLPDESQAWAVAAQAFHWAQPQAALPQVRRILQPGSIFTVLWNNRVYQENEVLRWTAKAIRQHVPEFDEAYRDLKWDEILASTGDFTFLSHHVVRHHVSMTKERFLDLWRSHNRLNNTAGPERFNDFFNELVEYLNHRQIVQVTVPYDCEAWSARRSD
jgi:SAM-dependent methyltransferase